MAPSTGDVFSCTAVFVASYTVLVFYKGSCGMMMAVGAIFRPFDVSGMVELYRSIEILHGIEVQGVRYAFGLGIVWGCSQGQGHDSEDEPVYDSEHRSFSFEWDLLSGPIPAPKCATRQLC